MMVAFTNPAAERVEASGQDRHQEINRLAFHLHAQRRLRRQHRGRAGAERSVVQVSDRRVEAPERGEVHSGLPSMSKVAFASHREWAFVIVSLRRRTDSG
jgi:hypothetical protein